MLQSHTIHQLLECGAASQLTLSLTDQLQSCSIASTLEGPLGSANVLVSYLHRVQWTSRGGSCAYSLLTTMDTI